MDAGQATQLGATIGATLAALGGWGTVWANRRNAVDGKTVSLAEVEEKRRQNIAQLAEERRQKDIDRIITTLQEQVEGLHGEMKIVKAENADCIGDRNQMRGELRRVVARLGDVEKENLTLRQQVAQLTRSAASAEVDGAM